MTNGSLSVAESLCLRGKNRTVSTGKEDSLVKTHTDKPLDFQEKSVIFRSN